MLNASIGEIRKKISAHHEGDLRQLEVVFSDSPRLVVEAPAGYGKTMTMISRIAYLYASGGIPNPKRILGLTFSVNAALKIRREIAEKLPALIGSQRNPITIGEKVVVTNYHGFCKSVLKKYGYLITDALRKDINLFIAVNDTDLGKRQELLSSLSSDERNKLKIVDDSIKNTIFPDSIDVQNYRAVVIEKFVPFGYITHNAIILFVLEIFNRFPEVREFYQSYYPLIVVDEFQDTNCVSWQLLETIISNRTQLVFLGDPLQRIFGFIGAMPDIMTRVVGKYNMTQVILTKNYRFRCNPEMLKLDINIRKNAAFCFAPAIPETEAALLPIFWGKTQQEEAKKVASKVQHLVSESTDRIAVLFWRRGIGVDIFEDEMSNCGIQYFYGMFSDDDPEYAEFHIKCQEMFIKKFKNYKSINKQALTAFSNSVKNAYASKGNKTTMSLLRLLDALIEKVSTDYSDLVAEDKYNLIVDILENRQLKQAMEYVDSQVILSTIHGAKGLEWEYVFLADVEQWVATFSCFTCTSEDKNNPEICYCRLPHRIPNEMKNRILDDLCVFYVGLTRAKKQAYISASSERFNSSNTQFINGKLCCFALIEGLKLICAQ